MFGHRARQFIKKIPRGSNHQTRLSEISNYQIDELQLNEATSKLKSEKSEKIKFFEKDKGLRKIFFIFPEQKV